MARLPKRNPLAVDNSPLAPPLNTGGAAPLAQQIGAQVVYLGGLSSDPDLPNDGVCRVWYRVDIPELRCRLGTTTYTLAPGAGWAGVPIQDEGTPLGLATTINLVGDGVVAAIGGGVATFTIPGGGGGAPHDLLDGSTHPDTAAGTVAQDDVIAGVGETPKWTRLAIAAQTLIGRITGGHVTGLTAAQAKTLLAIAADDLTDVDTATDPPALSEVMKWNGTNWVPAPYNYEFAFSIASFTCSESGTKLIGAGTWKAIGAITFGASYNNPPGGMTAYVAMAGGASNWANLYLTGTPPNGPTATVAVTVYPSTATGAITFTLHQSADGTTSVVTISFSNTMRYGTNAHGIGAQTDADVEALLEVAGPNESRDQAISNVATDAGHYLTFAWANRLSSVAQVQMDSGFGFVTASFAAAATTLAPTVQTSGLTAVQNSKAFEEAFKAITSRLTDLTNGTNDFKLLTSSTALNYLYWGELNKASGYTESDVESNYATQPGKVSSNSISSRSMVVNCGGSEYAYIAYPARLGALTSIMIGGFESLGDFNVDNTALAITNDAGYQENYRVYVSKNPGFTNPTTMTVTI